MNTTQTTGTQQGTQQPLQILIEDSVKGGVYSNAASTSVTANELILDFGYILPNEKLPTVKIVSRVNMSIKTAESLAQLLQGSIGDYYNKVLPAQQTAQPAQGAPAGQPAPAAMPQAQAVPPVPPVQLPNENKPI